MNNKKLKEQRPEDLQYKSKLTGEWKNMREKDQLDSFENFDRLGYEIRLNPNVEILQQASEAII